MKHFRIKWDTLLRRHQLGHLLYIRLRGHVLCLTWLSWGLNRSVYVCTNTKSRVQEYTMRLTRLLNWSTYMRTNLSLVSCGLLKAWTDPFSYEYEATSCVGGGLPKGLTGSSIRGRSHVLCWTWLTLGLNWPNCTSTNRRLKLEAAANNNKIALLWVLHLLRSGFTPLFGVSSQVKHSHNVVTYYIKLFVLAFCLLLLVNVQTALACVLLFLFSFQPAVKCHSLLSCRTATQLLLENRNNRSGTVHFGTPTDKLCGRSSVRELPVTFWSFSAERTRNLSPFWIRFFQKRLA